MPNSDLKTRWFPPSHRVLKDCPLALRQYITESGSLTRHLAHHCQGELQLSLNEQSWKRAFNEENRLLDEPSNKYTLIREIQLNCNKVPWVYARSIIPTRTYRLRQYQLSRLGLQPLGKLLFSDREIFRYGLEIGKIKTQTMFKYSSTIHKHIAHEPFLWARRSIFYIANHPLLVTEVFLPGSYSCPSKNV